MSRTRSHLGRAALLAALLLAGCAPPYIRSDMGAARRSGPIDVLAALAGACDVAHPGAVAPDAPVTTPVTVGRARRACAAHPAGATTPTPAGPVQKKP